MGFWNHYFYISFLYLDLKFKKKQASITYVDTPRQPHVLLVGHFDPILSALAASVFYLLLRSISKINNIFNPLVGFCLNSRFLQILCDRILLNRFKWTLSYWQESHFSSKTTKAMVQNHLLSSLDCVIKGWVAGRHHGCFRDPVSIIEQDHRSQILFVKIILNGSEEKALQRRGECLFSNSCYADFCKSELRRNSSIWCVYGDILTKPPTLPCYWVYFCLKKKKLKNWIVDNLMIFPK